MNMINEKDVMKFYLKLMNEDRIPFLVGHNYFKKEIESCITELCESESMHQKITSAKVLWKILFEASMSSIDPDKGGYDKIFEYFDEYVDFEELIFASDSFYRDHTLHCLWVYFLGEYLYYDEQYRYIFKDMDSMNKLLTDLVQLGEQFELETATLKDLIKMKKSLPDTSAIRCMAALTHDLGYPLKKIKKINQSVKKVLPFYGIDHFDEFDFKYQSVQQPLINHFLEYMSYSVNISNHTIKPSPKDSEMIMKLFKFRDTSKMKDIEGIAENFGGLSVEDVKDYLTRNPFVITFYQDTSLQVLMAQDFESYSHGIMSAYLLLRNLSAFKKVSLLKSEGMPLHVIADECKKFISMYFIFQAVASHTLEGYKIADIGTPMEFLAFIDEIEEFSRISRANQNREFVNEFCKTSIENVDGVFVINFIFDNEDIDNLDPERAFKGRCKKMLSLLDIPNLCSNFKVQLNCISKLSYDTNVYTLNVSTKFAEILINGEAQYIPKYLKSRQFYCTEDYQNM